MVKIILLILSWTLMSIRAEKPSWLPENADNIPTKCYEENQLKPFFDKDLPYDQLVNNTKLHNVLLCQLKAFNIYSEETGLNVDRFPYAFGLNEINCVKSFVQDCVDTHKAVASAGEMILKVSHCTWDKISEYKKSVHVNTDDC
ncbi:hypothetical protein FF38_11670 [Lucilia cuprina]|uniref:Uncharacterized protein n=1 Tax=Lucilia cuprina TaxID=7375 RepID=A0A0L0CEM7_LUCCU|nr:hypothetical protein CVS40_6248 [Lucilia cuprina]KNC30706.1 hypothetical protein FF38_11670 [Lucilia cuprina]